MADWKIDPTGVQTVLTSVQTTQGELATGGDRLGEPRGVDAAPEPEHERHSGVAGEP